MQLGTGISIHPAPTTLRRICTDAVEEMRAIYPSRVFQLRCEEEIPGEWDRARMGQFLSNLLGNAVQHGAVHAPIVITAAHDAAGVTLAVQNEGPPIAPHQIPRLFDCMFRGASHQRAADDNSTSLGLGLYIAREIITAHGGTITVSSTETDGTTFTAHLPPETPVTAMQGNMASAAAGT